MDAGLAFQLKDDLLNLVGDADAQGKDFRSDITEGKRTMIVTWAIEHLAGTEREELVSILSSHVTDTATLRRGVELMNKQRWTRASSSCRSWDISTPMPR